MTESAGAFLVGVRVLEVADELGEYCGKVLSGTGADVVKVESPQGEITRTYGPFYHDEPNPERSLYYWHYNFGKRSAVLDLDTAEGQESFRRLARNTDVVIDTRPRGWMAERGIGYEALKELNPGLVYARITPFGDDGPWADYLGSDIVHLALGGVMHNCGYDPDPFGVYETPPIAPQMWHAYHIAGEMMAMSVIAALIYRRRTGDGQLLEGSVHEAVAKSTETDTPDWVYLHAPHYRRTCRHSSSLPRTGGLDGPAISRTKDGRWLFPWKGMGATGFPDAFEPTIKMLEKYEKAEILKDPKFQEREYRLSPEGMARFGDVVDKLIGSLMYDRDLWREGQDLGMPWAPVRKPEENLDDPHWGHRETFLKVHHPELDETFDYVGAKWYAPGLAWRTGPRPPLLGEHSDEIVAEWSTPSPAAVTPPAVRPEEELSVLGKPFALAGVRVVDFGWMLASAGAGRYLAAFGAEVIKIEHETRWDGLRFAGTGRLPVGGRDARETATAPLELMPPTPNNSGNFMEINSGKLGVSVDLKSEEGKRIIEELIRNADIVLEGFSPGTMDRMGLGYERLKELNPRIIYAQQSGLGQHGLYSTARTFGPIAAAFTGLSEMSGLPDPMQPAGWGYSYLDWFGAYNLALATLAGLYRREITDDGCWIDSSQGESGTALVGTAILDYSVNGRMWERYGNRSPYKRAAPHGAFRTVGEDRWIAIAAFTDEQWASVAGVLGHPEWLTDERFATLDLRLENQDELERAVEEATIERDRYELQGLLQAAGVPAGVVQTAEDRYDYDPQLKHLQWVTELEQAELGVWPVKEHPVDLSESPAYIGGRFNRHGPNYGQDTDEVFDRLLDSAH